MEYMILYTSFLMFSCVAPLLEYDNVQTQKVLIFLSSLIRVIIAKFVRPSI